MRFTHPVLVAAAVAVVIGGGSVAVALGGWKVLGARFEDDTTLPAVTEIRVSGANVTVRVSPTAGSATRVHRTVRYLPVARRRPGTTHQVEGDVLSLDGGGWGCEIRYVVEAPRGVRVHARVTSGDLRLTGVSTTDVTTTSGAITLDDVTGDVTARSTSGSIRGTELHAAQIGATSTSGTIQLALAAPGAVQARTSTGDIRLTVPHGSYLVDAETRTGSKRVSVPDDPSGEHRLQLASRTGDLVVDAG